jgi:serine/threonine protein kinase
MTEPDEASPSVARIEVARLQVIKTLGDGGQGIVHQVAVPESLQPLMAYKQYKTTSASDVDWFALEGLVGLMDAADAETRSWLREHTAWPSTVVTANGEPRGFLMRLAPDDCFGELRTPKATQTLLALEFLLNPPDYLARINLLVSQAQRLGILRDLASALRRLHALGIVIGDLSPKDVVFGLGPPPRCFLIDCDAVSRDGVSVLRQVEAADWSVPDGEDLATPSSDIYKLGLLAVRLLAGDQSRTDVAVIPPSMPDLADLTRRSVSEEPARRPDPADWVAGLDAAIPMAATGIQPPPVSPGATEPPGTSYVVPPPAVRTRTGRPGRLGGRP